jgi:RNA polymerase sigma-70 factor (ECF subfamily)
VDHRRFLQKFVAHERLLTGYLLAATGNFHEAEDLLQEVSVALWESFDRYDESRPFQAWALGIARHKVQNWREQKGRARSGLSLEFLDLLGTAQREASDQLSERRPLLQRCVDALPAHLREMVELRYQEGLSLESIAGRLERTVGAIQVALVRVRRVLRECVDRKLAEAAGAGR